ncbi:MAG: hypothetical protein EOP84_22235 [Verrucomicrobiaceae bacterium]|nr:MAG: hypothetical protein EOP84_22235 [Verrucomicrobiaceae bacterium]
MPQPADIQDIIEGTYPHPIINENNDVLRALLPTSEEKTALTTLATSGAPIADTTGTEADNARAINQILAAMRASGLIGY